jgi:hypothetical protein
MAMWNIYDLYLFLAEVEYFSIARQDVQLDGRLLSTFLRT